MLHLRTILHPTDLSDPSQYALQFAHSLARDYKAKLVLLSVLPPLIPSSGAHGGGAPNAHESIQQMVDEEHQRVRRLVAGITDVPLEIHVRGGTFGPEIVQFSERVRADVIVMGTHGRQGVSRMLMGSVAEYVTQHAGCPVLTVRPAHPKRIPTDEVATDTSKTQGARP